MKETLAERIKKTAIKSAANYESIYLVDENGERHNSTASKKAIETCNRIGIVNKILNCLEVTANAYKDRITEWEIVFNISSITITTRLTGSFDYDNSIYYIDLSKDHLKPSIMREISEIVSRYLEGYDIRIYSSIREYGFYSCPFNIQIRLEESTNSRLNSIMAKFLNKSATEVIKKLGLTVSNVVLTEDEIKAKAETIAEHWKNTVIVKELEEAAFLGAKHLKIVFSSSYRGDVQFKLTGTPERINDRVIHTLETSDIDFFNYDTKKGRVINYIFQYLGKYLQDLGFTVDYPTVFPKNIKYNNVYYNPHAGFYVIKIELFNHKDIKNAQF